MTPDETPISYWTDVEVQTQPTVSKSHLNIKVQSLMPELHSSLIQENQRFNLETLAPSLLFSCLIKCAQVSYIGYLCITAGLLGV